MAAKVTGSAQLRAKLLALPQVARTEMRRALQTNGDEMVNLARTLTPVDEGDLRGSIQTFQGRDEMQQLVVAGGEATTRPVRSGVTAPEYDYAKKIEFEEQPFFFPAYRALKKRFKGRMTRAMTKAAKTVAGSGR